MLFFKKKTAAEKTAQDRELVAKNSHAIDALIALSTDGALTDKLEGLRHTLKYLIPFEDGDVKNSDKRIGELVDDLRIELNKTSGAASAKTEKLVKDIEVAIASRRTEV